MRAASRSLTSAGMSCAEVLAALDKIRADTTHPERRVPAAETELETVLQRAAGMFAGGAASVGHSAVRRLELELVSMVARLLGGNDDVVGHATTGAAENALLVVKAARDLAAQQRTVRRPEVVMPSTAHPAFAMACQWLDVKPVRTPVGPDYCADTRAMRKAITKRTILMVASAPSHPHGIVDPVEPLAKIASRAGIPLHVDATASGLLLPFVRALGRPLPRSDFRVEGVSSLGLDLRASAGALTCGLLLYADNALRRHQYYATSDWPGAPYGSTVPHDDAISAPVASAWAWLQRHGHDGCKRAAHDLMRTVDQVRDGIERLEHVSVLGEPLLQVLAIASKTVDMAEVASTLAAKGWKLSLQQQPTSLRIVVDRTMAPDVLLADMREALRGAHRDPVNRLMDRSRRLIKSMAARWVPAGLTSRVGLTVENPETRALPPSIENGAVLPLGMDERAMIDALDRMARN